VSSSGANEVSDPLSLDYYNLKRSNVKIREVFARWINQYTWNWWATLTFRFAVRNTITAKKYFHTWISRDVMPNVSNVAYFMVVEMFSDGEAYHIHSVLKVELHQKNLFYKNPYIYPFWCKWKNRYGAARIEVFDQRKGLDASYYISKYIVKEICDWDIGGSLTNEKKKL
jgi:hypothetical protein